jgi:predicted MFS family arabinose efflux permease
MAVSKVLHPLWFDVNGSMPLFGLSYSMMAMAGYLSFFSGILINRFGATSLLSMGSLVYSGGLACRVWHSSAEIAMASGLLCGLGASLVIVGVKPWIMSWSPKEKLTDVVGIQTQFIAVGSAVGLTLAGGVAYLVDNSREFLFLGLLFSAIGPLLAAFSVWPSRRGSEENTVSGISAKESIVLLRKSPYLSCASGSLAAITGFYMSIVAPYIPVLLKEQGFDVASLTGVMLLILLMRVLVVPKFNQMLRAKHLNAKWLFLLGESTFALIMALLYFDYGPFGVVVLLCLRAIAMTASAYGEQLEWMSIYTSEQAAVFFSLSQGFFFLGDALGGLIAGKLYTIFGVNWLMAVSAGVIALNALLTFLFFRMKEAKLTGSAYGECTSL